MTSTGTNRDLYFHQQQLYQELRYLFPNATEAMLIAIMKKHSNHRERCIDDLRVTKPSSHQYVQQLPPGYRPGARSHSVSGVPGGDARTYGFRHPSSANLPERDCCPLTAPVTCGQTSPFVLRWDASAAAGSDTSNSASFGSPLPLLATPGRTSPRPPPPPVPPPTYRAHVQQQVMFYAGAMPSPPVRHNNYGWSAAVHDDAAPYHSQLHISINANDGTVSASKHDGRSDVLPATSSSTLFDEDDPEQERLTHKPLVPQLSPSPGRAVAASSPPCWPYAPSRPHAANNDEAYAQALIVHQREQLKIIERELSRECRRLHRARNDVADKEAQLFGARTRFHHQIFPTIDDIQRLWFDIRSLCVDCECMTRVFDLLHKGRVPLGETDRNFYDSLINTGQQGPVLQEASRQHEFSPTIDEKSASGSLQQSSTRQVKDDDDDDDSHKWSCSACTFLNDPALERCEMCEMPRVVLAVNFA